MQALPHSNFNETESNRFKGVQEVSIMHLPRPNPFYRKIKIVRSKVIFPGEAGRFGSAAIQQWLLTTVSPQPLYGVICASHDGSNLN